ncbi:somatomedin-B and thrombospondin type-1 domain-containing protein-like isoform X2 [Antechinus flavipes]|uniref:somatomedin-B and thrombospondin type-1 domain-containing protein-like isoform X2 n=1 Tax=Antechinus flavipes TaxID=38775 RepID=UPI00223646D3|nr:somatomedin-B and thrombospondin type-1 domain-containing protein-like isoform X2 [Antechinus flavipes]
MAHSAILAWVWVLALGVIPGVQAGCADLGRCCPGRDLTCVSRGWTEAGLSLEPHPCYCDQACSGAGDCCPDYGSACPGWSLLDYTWKTICLEQQDSSICIHLVPVPNWHTSAIIPHIPARVDPQGLRSIITTSAWHSYIHFTAVTCVVSEWSGWSRCIEPCTVTFRVRRREVLREPRNGGGPCPALEERAGCVEYWSDEGVECKQALIPALITTGAFRTGRKKRAVALERKSAGDQLLQWQAVGNPSCRGTWKRFQQLEACSCPAVHSFLFV